MIDRVMAADKEDFILVKALGRPSSLLKRVECEVSIQCWTDSCPPTPYPYLTTHHRMACDSKETAFFYAEAIANQKRMDIKYQPLVESTDSKGE